MLICKKCNKSFPTRIVIDGKTHYLQRGYRKFCLECSPFKKGNNLDLSRENKRFFDASGKLQNQTHKTCPICQLSLSDDKFYISKRKNGHYRLASYCKKCHILVGRIKNNIFKERAVHYKGDKCQDCRNEFTACVYDFHHLDPTQKDFDIANHTSTSLDEKIKKELDKCILLCSNCHRIRHFKEREKESNEKFGPQSEIRTRISRLSDDDPIISRGA